MGITAVIAPSFSDIFSGNAFKNGIVPVVLPQAAIDRLVEAAQDGEVTVDLETMTVTTPLPGPLRRSSSTRSAAIA